MKTYFEQRAITGKKLRDAREKIEQITGNGLLSESGQKQEIEPIKSEVSAMLKSVIGKTVAALESKRQYAADIVNQGRVADPAKLSLKAQTLGPALSAMDYEQLIKLYNTRFNEPAERVLIEDVFRLKLDSDSDGLKVDQYRDKFDREQNKLNMTLPGSEKIEVYHEEANYLDNLQKTYTYDLQEWEGHQIKGPDMIHRTNALHNVRQFEAKHDYQTPDDSTLAWRAKANDLQAKIMVDREKFLAQ